MKKQTKRYNMILIGLILVLLVFIGVWKLQKREDLYFHVVLAVRLLLSCQNWLRSLMVKSLLVSVM